MSKKTIGMIGLSLFAMAQISACFIAGMKTDGIVSISFFILGGISCLFGLVLDFLLLIIAVDVFGSVFGSLAINLTKKQTGEEDEEDVEIIETPE